MSPTNYVTRFMVSSRRCNVKRSGNAKGLRSIEYYRRARTAQRHIRALHHIEHVPTQQLETGCLRVSNAPHEQCKDADTSYQHRDSYGVVIEPMPCRYSHDAPPYAHGKVCIQDRHFHVRRR